MSRENIELINRIYRAWNEEGVAGIGPFLAADAEWIDPPGLPGGGTHRGRTEIMEFLREWEGTVGVVNLEFEVEEVLETSDGYLVVSVAQGSGGSDTPIPRHNWFHWLKIRDRVVVRAQLFLDRGEALEAVGLRE